MIIGSCSLGLVLLRFTNKVTLNVPSRLNSKLKTLWELVLSAAPTRLTPPDAYLQQLTRRLCEICRGDCSVLGLLLGLMFQGHLLSSLIGAGPEKLEVISTDNIKPRLNK